MRGRVDVVRRLVVVGIAGAGALFSGLGWVGTALCVVLGSLLFEWAGRSVRRWCLSLLLVPLVVGGVSWARYSRWQQAQQWHRGSTDCFFEITSVAWAIYSREDRGQDRLPEEISELGATGDEPHGAYCDTFEIDFCWVGGGLTRDELGAGLVAFCPTANPAAFEHVHFITGRGGRQCGDNSTLIERLRESLALGESGEAPYSRDSMALMRRELSVREDWERRRNWLWLDR